MAWLGVVFALLAIAALVLPAKDASTGPLAWITWAIWALFALDFVAKFWLAPHKLHFLRTHWLSLLGLITPTLRVLSFVRLLRLGRALPAIRAVGGIKRARGLLQGRVAYLGGLTSLAILLFAELAYGFERGPHSTLPTFGSALVWATASVIGQSPTVTPASPGGQIVMLACLALGVVNISTLAGVIGAYLLHPADHAR